MTTTTLLRACDVTLSYYDGDTTTHAVQSVSLSLPSAGFVGIMGPSGSGKSSLLYLLSALKSATAGFVEYEGIRYDSVTERRLTNLRRGDFGFVFQQPFLLNYLTASENVLTAAPAGDRNAGRRADALMERLGIHSLRDKFPYQMSGGERQRVCVARAIMNRPRVIFADEPTAALDHANGHAVMDLLTEYRKEGLVLVVTHDPEMLAGADHVYYMRDGVLLPEGHAEIETLGSQNTGTRPLAALRKGK